MAGKLQKYIPTQHFFRLTIQIEDWTGCVKPVFNIGFKKYW